MSLEANKIAAAILVGGIITLSVGIATDFIYQPRPGAEATPEGAAAPAAKQTAPLEPVLGLLATADAAKGEAVAKKCSTCHTFDPSGANKVGPGLYGVIGRAAGTHEGFAYSEPMKAHAKPWTFADLNHFLARPKEFIPGTKMSFPGLPDVQDRADLLAWMNQQSASPAPLPTREEIEAEKAALASQQPAEGEAAPAAEGEAAPAAEGEAAPAAEGAAAPAEGVAPAAEPAAEPAAQPAAQAAAEASPESGAEGAAPAAEPAAPAAESGEAAAPAQGEQTAAAPAGDNAVAMIATADPAKGEKVAAKCKACHDMTQAAKNKVGPPLWGVVGRNYAAVEGFAYSDVLKGMADKPWSFEELDRFLAKPKEYTPGTKMAFPGLPKVEDRAALLRWLRDQSDSPVPLPQ